MASKINTFPNYQTGNNDTNLTVDEVTKLSKLYNKLSDFKIEICQKFEVRYNITSKEYLMSDEDKVTKNNYAPYAPIHNVYKTILTVVYNNAPESMNTMDYPNSLSFPKEALEYIKTVQEVIYNNSTNEFFGNESGAKIILNRMSHLIDEVNRHYKRFKKNQNKKQPPLPF